MNQITIPLGSKALDPSLVGGKAANLSRLVQGGFNVPGGFVLTTNAYRHFVETNDLAQEIEEALTHLDPEVPSSFDDTSRSIRSLFAEAPIPAGLRREIVAAYEQRIPIDQAVAVRSSATAEDLPDASFAGQQETFLNISGSRSLLSAVVRCWSSLWTGRAIAYRHRADIAPESVAMAVVVQKMVPARSAGVLFTVDAVTGRSDRMMINATWGLGDRLVEGQVTPDTFYADRDRGSVLESTSADKAIAHVIGEDGLLREEDVPLSDRRKLSLSPEQVSALVRLGRRIETLFGVPQDIEWALYQGRLYILQSRPITTRDPYGALFVPGDDEWPPGLKLPSRPYDLWTQADFGERWPEPLTPLTWSFWKPLTESMMQQNFAALGEPWIDEIEWMRRSYGRAYMNEGALAHVLSHGYGMPARSMSEGMGSVPLLDERYPGYRWGTIVRRLPVLISMVRNNGRLITGFEEDFSKIDRWVDDFMQRDLSSIEDGKLFEEANEIWLKRALTYLDAHGAATSQSMTEFGRLQSTLEKALGEPMLAQQAVTNISGVIQAELVPDFERMASLARESDLSETILDGTAGMRLERIRESGRGEPFLAELERFLRRHGHRCVTEADFLYPRWSEEPELVLEQLVIYLENAPARVSNGGQAGDPGEAILSRLSPLRRPMVRRSIQSLQHLVRMRDNGQHYLVKLLLPIRHIYATFGERWAERGWIDDAELVFFMLLSEMESIVGAEEPSVVATSTADTASQRRVAWQHWMEQRQFPAVLNAEGRPYEMPVESGDGTMSGLAVSGGDVVGRARVILSASEGIAIEKGEILVTRATDPGWTPLFSVIGGLVLEIGGQLSHGAIVAREYGLPAVVNVVDATRRIADGDRVRVDGTRGTVTILESAAQEDSKMSEQSTND